MKELITIVETKQYQTKSLKILSENNQKAIVDYLALHPKTGKIMQGTGGIRKLRWGKDGKGKSGGIRIIYYFYNEKIPLFLLTFFAKNEKDNLSKMERNELKKLTILLKQQYGEV